MSEKNIEEEIDFSLLKDFEENSVQAIKDFLKNNPGKISTIVLASNTVTSPEGLNDDKRDFVLLKSGNNVTLGLMLAMLLLENVNEPFVKIGLSTFQKILAENENLNLEENNGEEQEKEEK
jgi:hypothetical protein